MLTFGITDREMSLAEHPTVFPFELVIINLPFISTILIHVFTPEICDAVPVISEGPYIFKPQRVYY